MAEGFARALAGERWDVYSAGSKPSGEVNGKAIAAMAEVGIDLTTHHSTGLEALPDRCFDVVVTMGCGDSCPGLRAHKRVDWQIPDPKDLGPEAFARVRDMIRQRVAALLGP